MPDRRLVLDLGLCPQPRLLEPRGLFVDQPRMRPPVGQALRRVAGELGECVVELDDGATAIGDEEPLLQRVHHGVAELVAVLQIVGASALLLGSTCRGVQRSKGVQQKRQRLRAVEARNLLYQFVDQPGVLLDDLEHADVVVQRLAPELVSDTQVVRTAGLQVSAQRGLVLVVEIVGRHAVTTSAVITRTGAVASTLNLPVLRGRHKARAQSNRAAWRKTLQYYFCEFP